MVSAGLAAQATAQAVGDALGAQQLAGSALAAVVVIGALAAAIWAGRRLRADANRALDAGAPAGPSELTSRHVFRVLQERNIASVEAIAAMSPRERQLLFDAVARKVTPVVGVPSVPTSAGSAAAVAAVPVAKDAPIGALHCPACGTAITAAAAASRIVAPCDQCGRRIAARRDGMRVSVTADDPRRPASSGGDA